MHEKSPYSQNSVAFSPPGGHECMPGLDREHSQKVRGRSVDPGQSDGNPNFLTPGETPNVFSDRLGPARGGPDPKGHSGREDRLQDSPIRPRQGLNSPGDDPEARDGNGSPAQEAPGRIGKGFESLRRDIRQTRIPFRHAPGKKDRKRQQYGEESSHRPSSTSSTWFARYA